MAEEQNEAELARLYTLALAALEEADARMTEAKAVGTIFTRLKIEQDRDLLRIATRRVLERRAIFLRGTIND